MLLCLWRPVRCGGWFHIREGTIAQDVVETSSLGAALVPAATNPRPGVITGSEYSMRSNDNLLCSERFRCPHMRVCSAAQLSVVCAVLPGSNSSCSGRSPRLRSRTFKEPPVSAVLESPARLRSSSFQWFAILICERVASCSSSSSSPSSSVRSISAALESLNLA